ncbi:MAG: glycosyltransferase family 2 protein [Lachnospiraceae bacterium]|nr:glycosyltransferase family 2 protein [Lachnospiraceae bacterium]
MPVYNNAGTLDAAVQSVLAQTRPADELILVDDGSTDESPSLTDGYAAAHPERIRVIHRENGGLMRAWMDGLENTDADYVCFLDSDDTIDARMLEALAGELKSGTDGRWLPGQIICCAYRIIYPDGRTRDMCHGAPAGIYEGDALTALKDGLLGHSPRRVILSRCMKLTDRRLIADNLSLMDPSIRMGEDVNTMVPALLDAARVVLTNDPFYHYYHYAASMAHGYDPGLLANCQRLRERLRVILREKGRDEAAADREFYYLFLLVIKNEFRKKEDKKTATGAVSRIRDLCLRENIPQLSAGVTDPPAGTGDRMLIRICRKPSAPRILAAQLLFALNDLRAPRAG